ncbi:plasma membrane ATPase 2-like [Macadamia integrifolia]|uniref:plasma membrane ATPase 2-like n=1 Tax=Macadamia integrifolia TaxID=60698 RepID=UPI001C529DC5|nr:plasma membrane ATPase 2-like [Macadamia integrifolia]
MYVASSLLDRNREVDDLIEKADCFAGIFPEHKYEIDKILQEKKHICGITGDGVKNAPALKKADSAIAVSVATHSTLDVKFMIEDLGHLKPTIFCVVSRVLDRIYSVKVTLFCTHKL